MADQPLPPDYLSAMADFLLLGLLIRHRRTLLWLLLPAIWFVTLYGPRFIPHQQQNASSETRELRVMTYNVLNRNTQFDAVAELILDSKADFVGLQELIPANAKPLAELLEDEYPYHTPLPTEHKLQVGLFSRYPILTAKQLHLPWRDLSWEAIVDLDGNQIKIVVVHFIPTLLSEVPPSEWSERIVERQDIRRQQVSRVLDSVNGAEMPVVVLCDCNFTEFSVAYTRLEAVVADSFAEVGWGFGHTIHPVGRDVRLSRIDYIWHSPHFIPLWARVEKNGLSDHNPVVVGLQLVGAP